MTAFETPIVQQQMNPKGSGLQHIHLEDLRADCIPIPPLAEQNRIVTQVDRQLSVIRESEAQVDANLQRSVRLRRSILSGMFSLISKSKSIAQNSGEPTRQTGEFREAN